MRTLVIETATAACSVALFSGSQLDLLDSRHETIGRGHAEKLVPLIAELPNRGRAERIAVSLGPGSFTGTRIGIAAARALGIAWGAQVVGFPTLALVAAGLRSTHPNLPVTVAMTGGHGEWFVQGFDADGLPQSSHASLTPEAAVAATHTEHVVGSKAEALLAERGSGTAHDMLPNAAHFPLLPAAAIQSSVSAIYGRAPDAKLPA